MKIALLGYGKMGRLIDHAAASKGHQVVAKIGSVTSDKSNALADADLLIDFSLPHLAVEHIELAIETGKNIVVGTTGWYEHLAHVKKRVNESKIGMIYSPNFSIGVQLFLKLAHQAGLIFSNQPGYNAHIVETHHLQKKDAPSGTALALAQSAEVGHKIPITSVRSGFVPGEHTLVYDSPIDTITLTHSARSREGFALGAVTAAEWILGKKGVYTVNDMMESDYEKN